MTTAAEVALSNYFKKEAKKPLRQKDFMAGFEAGVNSEKERIPAIVAANFTLFNLVRMFDENPWLVKQMNAEQPASMQRLRDCLEGK